MKLALTCQSADNKNFRIFTAQQFPHHPPTIVAFSKRFQRLAALTSIVSWQMAFEQLRHAQCHCGKGHPLLPYQQVLKESQKFNCNDVGLKRGLHERSNAVMV